MNPVLGLLFLLLPSAIAPSPAPAVEGPAFDRQLEHFTQLAIEGKTREASAFLRHPGFLDASDHEGHTALFAAAVACNTEVLDQVLAVSPRNALNHRDKRGATALFYAASQGRNDVLRRLVQHGADVNLADSAGKTPLQVAVLMNHPDAVRLLLDAGAQINAQDKDGATALLHAVQAGRVELADLLLKRGADARLARNDGLTPLQAATAKLDQKLIDRLRHDEMAAQF
jgi:ankyrin repeat protein